jgi:hypothetical protein
MIHLLPALMAVVHGGHGPSFGRQRFHELIDAYVSSRRP